MLARATAQSSTDLRRPNRRRKEPAAWRETSTAWPRDSRATYPPVPYRLGDEQNDVSIWTKLRSDAGLSRASPGRDAVFRSRERRCSSIPFIQRT
jgi:hypothetical protein